MTHPGTDVKTKTNKRRRNRPGNFAGYGKPSYPAAKAYPFEWGRINGQ